MRNRLARLFLPLAVGTFLISSAKPAWSQSCTWGGTPTMSPPASSALGVDQAHLQTPARLAVDTEGKVYVADTSAGRVMVRDPWGRLVSVKQGLSKPLAVAVDAFGLIYVGEASTGSVSVFGPWWDLRFRFGQGEGEFAMPNHIAIDPDPSHPRVYVADSAANTVKVYSNLGGLLFQFGGKGTGSGQFDFPAGIHVSLAGEVFVADQNNDRVQVFDRSGTFVRCFGGSSTRSFRQRFGRIQGVTSDGDGRIYVADAFQGSVWVFEPGGAQLGTVGSFGEGTGELVGVGGLAVDTNNRLLVASMGSGRVASYGLDAFSNPRAVHANADFLPPERNLHIDRRKTQEAPRSERGAPDFSNAAPFSRREPRPFDRWRILSIEFGSGGIDQVRLNSIVANGVRAARSGVGDRDSNGVPEITAYFERTALVATFPDDAWATGEGFVGVTGELFDGTPFEATGVLDLRNEMKKDEMEETEAEKNKEGKKEKKKVAVEERIEGRQPGAAREQHQ